MFKIEATVYRINLLVVKKLVHAFWLLKNDENEVVATLHGLATSRSSGLVVPIGFSADHSLRAYHEVYDPDLAFEFGSPVKSQPILPWDERFCECIYQGSDALERWNKAVAIIDHINQLDLPYSPLGVTIPRQRIKNSNTLYKIFADCMGLPAHRFPGLVYVGLSGVIPI